MISGEEKSTALHSIKNNNKAFLQKRKPFYLQLLEAVTDFVYPPVCELCKNILEKNVFLCQNCQSRLEQSLHVCTAFMASEFVHIQDTIHFDTAITCFDYSPDIELLIHAVKYRGRKRLGRFLGSILAKRIAEEIDSSTDLIVPVPLHRTRQRERGYNQSEALARGFAKACSLPIRTDCMKRNRHTRTQTLLSGTERQVNVKDAFSVRRAEFCKGKRILLIDDVITTGATMNSCAKALKEAGAAHVSGVALARPVLV